MDRYQARFVNVAGLKYAKLRSGMTILKDTFFRGWSHLKDQWKTVAGKKQPIYTWHHVRADSCGVDLTPKLVFYALRSMTPWFSHLGAHENGWGFWGYAHFRKPPLKFLWGFPSDPNNPEKVNVRGAGPRCGRISWSFCSTSSPGCPSHAADAMGGCGFGALWNFSGPKKNETWIRIIRS